MAATAARFPVDEAAASPGLPHMPYFGANVGSLRAGWVAGSCAASEVGPLAVTDEAIEKVKAMITSGALRAGDRLPREADLAADLGLSRSSLREAVRALSLVNILDVRQGDGTYVTSLQPNLLLEALSFIVDFHRDGTVLEFLRVRRILEPAAVAMAAERITETECQDLRALLDSLGPTRTSTTWSPTTWSSTGGSRPARGTASCAHCWRRCPGRPPGPGSGAA